MSYSLLQVRSSSSGHVIIYFEIDIAAIIIGNVLVSLHLFGSTLPSIILTSSGSFLITVIGMGFFF